MIYYLFFYSFEVGLFALSRLKRAHAFAFVMVLFAVLFSGMRVNTGYDFDSYYSFFSDIEDYESLIEPGFYYIVKALRALEQSPQALFFYFSAATSVLAFVAYTQVSQERERCFLIYLLVPGLYLNSFSIVRQGLAVAILGWAAFRFFRDGRFTVFILFAALAASIHAPAIVPATVVIIIRLTGRLPWRASAAWVSLTLAAIGSVLNAPSLVLSYFVGGRYDLYVEDIAPPSLLRLIGYNILAIAVLAQSRKFATQNVHQLIFRSWIVGACLFNFFSAYLPITRIYYYFIFMLVPLLVLSPARDRATPFRSIPRDAWVLFFGAALIVALISDLSTPYAPKLVDFQFFFESP